MNSDKRFSGLAFAMGLVTVFLLSLVFTKNPTVNPTIGDFTLKNVDDKSLLITSAGQSTDTYILQDIVNELRFHNLFMPQATSVDADSVRAMLVVVGYSEVGLKLQDKTYDDEYERVKNLIEQAHNAKIPVVGIYLGGKERRAHQTDKLLELVAGSSNFIISTYSGDADHKLSVMASDRNIPMSLIDQIPDLTEPLASVFR